MTSWFAAFPIVLGLAASIPGASAPGTAPAPPALDSLAILAGPASSRFT